MKFLLILPLVLLAAACGQKSEKFHSVPESSFERYVNDKDLSGDPNLSLDKSILNADYPIQIALYRNGKFYYDLPNLDDGEGTWTYSGGQIVLKSKHRLFDMRIDVRSLDEKGEKLAITFIDRHGPQTLRMENSQVD